jgi:hypothetical protein
MLPGSTFNNASLIGHKNNFQCPILYNFLGGHIKLERFKTSLLDGRSFECASLESGRFHALAADVKLGYRLKQKKSFVNFVPPFWQI